MNAKPVIKTKFIEPIDVLFFRDAIPMGAGVGKGAGSRLPFPTTLHEAFRSSLLISIGKAVSEKTIDGRPREAIRKGNWHEQIKESPVKIAAREFRSLNVVGPFPYLDKKEKGGLFLPVPLDCSLQDPQNKEEKKDDKLCEKDRKFILHRLQLLWDKSQLFNRDGNPDAMLRCLPVATRPPSKESELKGYWTVEQYKEYLAGTKEFTFYPTRQSEFWKEEHRVGVQINPETFASEEGKIYAGVYMRPEKEFRFACQLILKDPRNGEAEALEKLDWLLFGGEHRLAKLASATEKDPFADELFKPPGAPQTNGPILLKWILVTPAIFAHGSLPGWCVENRGKNAPPGFVALDMKGRASLVSWCVGRPVTVSGFDVVDWRAKDTLLAVPAGSVYYFLCENADAANELAEKLHWKPRSDYYGEKGCGYGFVSFDVHARPLYYPENILKDILKDKEQSRQNPDLTSEVVKDLANQIFKQ